MKMIAEFTFFLGVATVSHLALFQSDTIGTPGAAGDAGQETITLAASTQTLAALVQNWERPVEIWTEVGILTEVMLPQQTALVQQLEPAARSPQPVPRMQPNALPALDAMKATQDDTPQIDTTVPPPPETFSADASPRPKGRPTPPAAKTKPTPAPQVKATKQATQKSAKKKAEPATRQVAAGNGQGKAAGTAKAAKSPAKKQASSPALMAQWGSQIRSAVERRKTYPSGTRARGKVVLAVAVSSNGALSSVRVRSSSGHAVLDRAAVAAVKRARFKAAPKGLPGGVHQFSLPVTFAP